MKHLLQNKFWDLHKDYDKEKLLYLLIDRPNSNNRFNDFWWINNKGQWHRDYDLPDYMFSDGTIVWRKNNKLHRCNNKPTIIRNNGYKEHWLNNKQIKIIKPNFKKTFTNNSQ